jgi:hypothetical protein
MTEEKKKTVGEVATELAEKADNKHTVIDQMEENLTDYEKNVIIAAERGLKALNKDFYVVVLVKKEPLFENVFTNKYFYTEACPTPNYDQTVYQYIYKSDALKLLWNVPDKDTALRMYNYAPLVPLEEKQLLSWVIQFFEGDLDRLCRKLNKEPGDSPYLKNLNVVIQ